MSQADEPVWQQQDDVVPPREATRQETDAKCPQCGATMTFTPETGGMACGYCGFEKMIPPPEADEVVCEMDFDAAIEGGNYEWGAEKKLVICKSCGAETVYDALMVSDICPYCGATTVMQEAGQRSLAPGGVCPFEISSKAAEERFAAWIKKKIFTPRAAKKQAKADSWSGVYMPYWTFDSNTSSSYQAKYGRDRRVKRGDQYVTVTDWHNCSGVYQRFFDDVLINASSRQNDADVRKIEPYHTSKSLPYKPEYVAGFISERYSVGLHDGWAKSQTRIQEQLKNEIASYIKNQYRADRISNLRFSTRHDNVTYKYLILPLWLSSFAYKQKKYRFLVNGQTGRVGGHVPVSALRVAAAVLLGLAVLVLLLMLMDK